MFTPVEITDTGNTVWRCHESELVYVGLKQRTSFFPKQKWHAQWIGPTFLYLTTSALSLSFAVFSSYCSTAKQIPNNQQST